MDEGDSCRLIWCVDQGERCGYVVEADHATDHELWLEPAGRHQREEFRIVVGREPVAAQHLEFARDDAMHGYWIGGGAGWEQAHLNVAAAWAQALDRGVAGE